MTRQRKPVDKSKPRASSTSKKRRRRNKKVSKPGADSIASSMLFNGENAEKLLGLKGLFGGKIVHLSFDCPINLRTAWNEENMANGDTGCKNLQKFMASYVMASRLKRHAYGNTISRALDVPLSIENLNFMQYVQSRPRRYLPESSEVVSEEVEEKGEVERSECKKLVERVPIPDFEGMSLEELQRRYVRAVRGRDYARAQTLRFFIKQRTESLSVCKLAS